MPGSGRAALLALLTPRWQREPRMLSPEPAAEGAAGALPMSCLIAAELRLQPRFFPTCTGHGTSAAAPGSHRQRGG